MYSGIADGFLNSSSVYVARTSSKSVAKSE
jgi:hypothetical protein